jgi:endonuclease YncB( thermonuclease family)
MERDSAQGSPHGSAALAASAALALVATACVAMSGGCRKDAPPPPGYTPSHQYAQYLDIHRVQFGDGDTFLLNGDPIRILGIDTPEIKNPDVGIMEDQPYGPAAAESTRTLMTRAHTLEWIPDGKDYYGRRLAHVLVDGELLSVLLLEMGLAYENVSYFGDNGFPDLADRILKTSQAAPNPPFEQPYKWRKKHQKKL